MFAMREVVHTVMSTLILYAYAQYICIFLTLGLNSKDGRSQRHFAQIREAAGGPKLICLGLIFPLVVHALMAYIPGAFLLLCLLTLLYFVEDQ